MSGRQVRVDVAALRQLAELLGLLAGSTRVPAHAAVAEAHVARLVAFADAAEQAAAHVRIGMPAGRVIDLDAVAADLDELDGTDGVPFGPGGAR